MAGCIYENGFNVFIDMNNYLDVYEEVPKLKVFLVDDNPAYLQLLEYKLGASENVSVYKFTTGAACLDNMYLKPDLVVLDYHLYEDNDHETKGDELMKKIKEASSNTEVVMITGDDTIIKGKKAPCDILPKDDLEFSRIRRIMINDFRHAHHSEFIIWVCILGLILVLTVFLIIR